MDNTLLIILCALVGVAILFLIFLLAKKPADVSSLRAELRSIKAQNEQDQSLSRQETLTQFKNLNQISLAAISQISSNTGRDLESMRQTMDRRLSQIQEENQKQLFELRQMVDKNLSETVSAGLDVSFKSVSSQLEQVYKSMGEMQTLTADILDLKRILSNVKNRGTWGEIQLDALIGDILAPSQYERQFALGEGRERVDFAVRLPGDGSAPLYLPIDSKFPMDRYQAVLDAEEYGDERAKSLSKDALIKGITEEARKIRAKYVSPPLTTDFAVLFVPSEGLYGFLAAANLPFVLQGEHRVLLAGPSTLAALLNSLLMGFKTIAIQRQSGEILKLLGAVKKAFALLGTHLDSAGRSLQAADNALSRAQGTSRGIQRRLQNLEETDLFEAKQLLGEDLFVENMEAQD